VRFNGDSAIATVQQRLRHFCRKLALLRLRRIGKEGKEKVRSGIRRRYAVVYDREPLPVIFTFLFPYGVRCAIAEQNLEINSDFILPPTDRNPGLRQGRQPN